MPSLASTLPDIRPANFSLTVPPFETRRDGDFHLNDLMSTFDTFGIYRVSHNPWLGIGYVWLAGESFSTPFVVETSEARSLAQASNIEHFRQVFGQIISHRSALNVACAQAMQKILFQSSVDFTSTHVGGLQPHKAFYIKTVHNADVEFFGNEIFPLPMGFVTRLLTANDVETFSLMCDYAVENFVGFDSAVFRAQDRYREKALMYCAPEQRPYYGESIFSRPLSISGIVNVMWPSVSEHLTDSIAYSSAAMGISAVFDRVEKAKKEKTPCCKEPVHCSLCGECESTDCLDCECLECGWCGDKTAKHEQAPCGVHCTTCCRCYECDGCHEYIDGRQRSRCESCQNCPECCECRYCPGHDSRVSYSFCSLCDQCVDCCGCNDEDDSDNCVRNSLLSEGMLTFYEAKRGEFKQNTSKRHISVELEVANIDSEHYTLEAVRKWRDPVVEDGSLPEEGFEINTNPSSGDQFVNHVKEVCEALSADGAATDESCGMHCHVGARDFGYFDLFRLCRLYAKVEHALFQLVERDRYDCSYATVCHHTYPAYSFKTFKTDIINSMYGQVLPTKSNGRFHPATEIKEQPHSPLQPKLEERKYAPKWNAETTYYTEDLVMYQGGVFRSFRENVNKPPSSNKEEWEPASRFIIKKVRRLKKRLANKAGGKYEDCRYRALNIHSFFYRGTVEFRHHHGTISWRDATSWGMVCAGVIDAASRMSVREIDELSEKPFEALIAIMPEHLHKWMKDKKLEHRAKRSRRKDW